jgi:hypothetical protein
MGLLSRVSVKAVPSRTVSIVIRFAPARASRAVGTAIPTVVSLPVFNAPFIAVVPFDKKSIGANQ